MRSTPLVLHMHSSDVDVLRKLLRHPGNIGPTLDMLRQRECIRTLPESHREARLRDELAFVLAGLARQLDWCELAGVVEIRRASDEMTGTGD